VAVFHRVQRPIVVLGSTQPEAVVKSRRARREGIAVCRRRSGGGAVFVDERDPLWIDLWVPRGDPLWEDDVSRASFWIGEWWSSVLAGLGVPDVTVHQGRFVATRWSKWVCFAGRGAGEVLVGERKLLGIAQWRGREGALFHLAAYRSWDPDPLVRVLALGRRDRRAAARDLRGAVTGLDELLPARVSNDHLVSLLIERLPDARRWELQGVQPVTAASSTDHA